MGRDFTLSVTVKYDDRVSAPRLQAAGAGGISYLCLMQPSHTAAQFIQCMQTIPSQNGVEFKFKKAEYFDGVLNASGSSIQSLRIKDGEVITVTTSAGAAGCCVIA